MGMFTMNRHLVVPFDWVLRAFRLYRAISWTRASQATNVVCMRMNNAKMGQSQSENNTSFETIVFSTTGLVEPLLSFSSISAKILVESTPLKPTGRINSIHFCGWRFSFFCAFTFALQFGGKHSASASFEMNDCTQNERAHTCF